MFRGTFLFAGSLLIFFLGWRFLSCKLLIDHSMAHEQDNVYRLKPENEEAKANPESMRRLQEDIRAWADPYALAANIVLVIGFVGGFVLLDRKPGAITQKKIAFLFFWLLALAFAGSMLQDFSGNNEIGFSSIVAGYPDVHRMGCVHMRTGHGAYYATANAYNEYVGYIGTCILFVGGGYLCYFSEKRKRREVKKSVESSPAG